MPDTASVQDRIDRALEICRPYLQADGGDIELVRLTDDGIAELRFTGTCLICPLSRMTLRAGVERVVLKYVPEVRRVETVA